MLLPNDYPFKPNMVVKFIKKPVVIEEIKAHSLHVTYLNKDGTLSKRKAEIGKALLESFDKVYQVSLIMDDYRLIPLEEERRTSEFMAYRTLYTTSKGITKGGYISLDTQLHQTLVNDEAAVVGSVTLKNSVLEHHAQIISTDDDLTLSKAFMSDYSRIISGSNCAQADIWVDLKDFSTVYIQDTDDVDYFTLRGVETKIIGRWK